MNKATHGDVTTMGAALAILAARECCNLQRALAMHEDRQKSMHDARKCCRRLRSLLPLFPDVFEPATDEPGVALKQLAHSFAPLRDAHIAAHTARLLVEGHPSKLTPEVVDALEKRSAHLLSDSLQDDPGWAQRRVEAACIATLVNQLPWQEITPRQARKVLSRSRRRVEKAHRKAVELDTAEARHRWRRRVRKLRYQLEFLRKARNLSGMKKKRTKRYGEQAEALKALTDKLGWRQDFQVFCEALEQLPPSPGVQVLRQSLSTGGTDWTAPTAN